jgi:hypothetical protein
MTVTDSLRRGGSRAWRLVRAPQVLVPICLSHVDRQADQLRGGHSTERRHVQETHVGSLHV